jgi:threonine dehydratase
VVASGADRPTCDASDAGLDAPAIQNDAHALASEVTLASGNSKSSFSEIRTLVAGAADREDSLAPKRVGKLVYPIARRYVAPDVVLVSDAEISRAQATLWDRARVVAEPGGAAALAALISCRYQPASGERVAVLVCGGNTTAVDFSK